MKVTYKTNGNAMIEENGTIREYIPMQRMIESIDEAAAYNTRKKIINALLISAAVIVSFFVGWLIG